MIIPASAITAAPVAYSGGTPPSSQSGFGAALSAKLAELQTMTPGSSAAHRHHHDNGQAGMANQDAGNETSMVQFAGLGTGAISG